MSEEATNSPATGLPEENDLLARARRMLPGIVSLRRALHRDPELGRHLPRTQERVLESLEDLPLHVTTGTHLSSVTAVLEGARPGPTVLLRADMDALPQHEDTGLDFASRVPGAMHACGHDLHTAMLVGAARLLAERREELAGRVVFMFQPAEESGGGAADMIEEGVLTTHDGDSVDAAFALHVTTRFEAGTLHLRPGPMFAASDRIRLTVRGQSGHASAPHLALDPIPVACEIVQALQSLVTRTVNIFDPAVLTIARIEAGTTNNVIPESAELHGTFRTLTPDTRRQVRAGIERVARHICAAHGAEAGIELTESYPPLHNEPAFTAAVEKAVAARLGRDIVYALAEPVMGSEDFAYVLERIPGAMAFLGARLPDPPTQNVPDMHSNRVVFDEAAMATGIAVHAAVALQHSRGASGA
ncbi:hippurate hydrolase [Streptomyces longisporoflavus]|uniref:M20 metallopeptidase family protein n=1 Tax=Streptomyces longisporoflavus TaxID=28044 RepID=UPI0019C658FE|nr:M20 family metallopeptidase [Streptomyces longisporoflavus]GGV71353.1 hippurate hydrolase [Streptomyces longisporoflavus]